MLRSLTKIALVCSMTCCLYGGTASALEPTPVTDRTARVLEHTIPRTLRSSGEPSLAVALIENGAVTYEKAWGVADKSTGRAASTDTLYQIGSISKTIAAMCLMKLIDDGALGLDDRADDHLKSWKLESNGGDASRVTIRQLLSHTAGTTLSGYPGIPVDDPTAATRPSTLECLRAEKECAEHGPVLVAAKPGGAFSYSGGGYTVLQHIMEEKTGKAIDRIVQECIGERVGATSLRFGWPGDLAERVAAPHTRDGSPLRHRIFGALAAAGGYATAGDLARVVAQFCDQHKAATAASRESLREMMQPVTTARPGQQYGLALVISGSSGAFRTIAHNGSNVGWKAMFRVIPQRGIGLVVMTNSDEVKTAMAALKAWEDAVSRAERSGD